MTPLNDNSTHTCSAFVAHKPQMTQIFKPAVCTTDQMSVTLVGEQMKCGQNVYVVGLKGADVGKPFNTWKTCKPRWQETLDSGVEWCNYDCSCTGGCEQVMVSRRPQALVDSSWILCDITQYCNGNCIN